MSVISAIKNIFSAIFNMVCYIFLLIFSVLIVCIVIAIGIDLITTQSNNKIIIKKFNYLNYNNVHYEDNVKRKSNNSLIKNTYLVYDFDTLNRANRINTHLHTNAIISNFENFESFVSHVINNFDSMHTHVLVRISSPGGEAYKFEKLYSSAKRLKQYGFKTIAFIDDICASGCYMVACAFDKIVATETSKIGSIGVTTSHINYKGLLDLIGIKEKTFGTGKYKGQNNFNGDDNLTNQYALVEESLNQTLKMFLKIVSTRKNVDLEYVSSAQVWYGSDAYKLNLIDKIGHIDDYLYKLSQNNKNGIYYVVSYKNKETMDISSLFRILSSYGFFI